MRIAVIGLGLIGGSFARAACAAGITVYGLDRDAATVTAALAAGAISATLTPSHLRMCEVVVIAVPPCAVCDFVAEYLPHFAPRAIVVDCCGVKGEVVAAVTELLDSRGGEHSIRFVGGHPMAGSERGGFTHSTATLFHGASMILCPADDDSHVAARELEPILLSLGFARIVFATPAEHDAILAYTSHLPHLLANAFVQSPTAKLHDGFSAGSFRDATRVAPVSETLWADIFLANRENIVGELDTLIERLKKYRAALANAETDAITRLLHDGRIAAENCG
ncbi:MAG: prephenate dehydrogenase [Thermoguttaceae bacterium]